MRRLSDHLDDNATEKGELTAVEWDDRAIEVEHVVTEVEPLNDDDDYQLVKAINHIAKAESPHKNLWINGNCQIWDYGDSGVQEYFKYATNRLLIRGAKKYNTADSELACGGTVNWERGQDSDRQFIRITHTDAIDTGYIGTKLDRDILLYVKGKTVTLQFEYRFSSGVTGSVVFYVDRDNDGMGESMAVSSTSLDYIADGQWHKQEVTVDITDDNIIEVDGEYFGVNIYYGEGAVPNGTYDFSRIQFEVNSKATEFEFINEALEATRCARYYREIRVIRAVPWGSNFMFGELLSTPMRVTPTVGYTLPTDASLVGNYTNYERLEIYCSSASGTTMYATTLDAEIY